MARLFKILNRNYASSVAILALLVGVGLYWLGKNQLFDYQNIQHKATQVSMQRLSEQLQNFLNEKKQLLELYSSENEKLISVLPQVKNSVTVNRLTEKFKTYFKEASMLYIRKGNNIVFRTSPSMQKIKYVHDKNSNFGAVLIKQDGTLYVDLYFPFNNVSLVLRYNSDTFEKMLSTNQIFEHYLILTDRYDHQKILSSRPISREFFQDLMIDKNSQSISQVHKKGIENNWEIIGITDPESYQIVRKEKIIELIYMYFIFTFCSIFLVWRLRIEEVNAQDMETKKDAMLGVIAHEFRTPITAITGSLELYSMIKQETKTDSLEKSNEECNDLVKMATHNAQKLCHLVNDFLDLQEIDSENYRLEYKEVGVFELVKKVTEDIKIYGEKFGVNFEIKSEQRQTRIKADPNRIEQVLTNLMSNAAKYGGNNKSVEIIIESLEDRVRVSVKDHGPGIPEENQKLLFEKFAVHKSKRSKRVESSGLGLSICKTIIEKHKGVIGFYTKANMGTTFYFELPINSS